MPGFRTRALPIAAALAVAAALVLRGQQIESFHVEYVGLPAVDLGVSEDISHAPDTPEHLARVQLRAALRTTASGSTATPFAPRRIIVRFRDDASPAARGAVLSDVTSGAVTQPRGEFANFDIVRLSASDDVESVAQALTDRSDVVLYAQPSYLVHTMFKPND